MELAEAAERVEAPEAARALWVEPAAEARARLAEWHVQGAQVRLAAPRPERSPRHPA